MGVALYFIDKLALRAGHEKDDDEADTVGCCTLKVCDFCCVMRGPTEIQESKSSPTVFFLYSDLCDSNVVHGFELPRSFPPCCPAAVDVWTIPRQYETSNADAQAQVLSIFARLTGSLS